MQQNNPQQEQQINVIKQAFSTALRELFENNDSRKYISVVQKFHQLSPIQLILTFKALSRITNEIVHSKSMVNNQYSNCKDLIHAILSTSTKVMCSNNKDLQNSFDTLCLVLYTTSSSTNSTLVTTTTSNNGTNNTITTSIHEMIISCLVEHFLPIPDFELKRIEENNGG